MSEDPYYRIRDKLRAGVPLDLADNTALMIDPILRDRLLDPSITPDPIVRSRFRDLLRDL